MKTRNRRVTPKGILEKVSGRKVDPNLLPASQKVQIMEFLLSCDYDMLGELADENYPAFIMLNARLLIDRDLRSFIGILRQCRLMAREDALNAK